MIQLNKYNRMLFTCFHENICLIMIYVFIRKFHPYIDDGSWIPNNSFLNSKLFHIQKFYMFLIFSREISVNSNMTSFSSLFTKFNLCSLPNHSCHMCTAQFLILIFWLFTFYVSLKLRCLT